MNPPRSLRLTLLTSLAVIAPLVPFVPLGQATASPSTVLTVTNPGFEQGATGWTFTSGTGVATNAPHNGSKLAYLDEGTAKKVSQTMTATGNGVVDLSAWVTTGGAGATFVAKVNGTVVGSLTLAGRSAYTRYTIPRVAVQNGDAVEISIVGGAGVSYVNVDDIEATTSVVPAVEITNPGFEQGATGWTFTSGTGVATNLPHGGSKLAYLDQTSAKKVTQTVTATGAGTFDFSTWAATGGTGGKFLVRVNGTVAGSVDLPSRSSYSRHTVSRVTVKNGDQVQVGFEGGTSWVNVDDLSVSPSAPVDPVVSSSDPKIVAMFDWAKRKANSFVQLPGAIGPINVDEGHLSGTGTAPYGPSYWAGYANRSGYYTRDMAHQVGGASVLGLNAENKAMLRTHAASATAEHKYYPVWAFNFDNQNYLATDYSSANFFVREVPATFEVVEKANAAYRWSGDSAYINDPVLWDYYKHATKEFIELHDGRKPNGVAEGEGTHIFAGAASYKEDGDLHVIEAGDGIAAQYQAFRAMSDLAASKGDTTLSNTYRQKADDLKAYFNNTWAGSGNGADMIRAYTKEGAPVTGWGKEMSWIMLQKEITSPGARSDAYLDYVDTESQGSGRSRNIEAYTYLPDTFFTYDRNDTAWKWMQYVYDQRDVQHVNSSQGPNGDYPEVSYTLVSQTVEGLMGVQPNAPANALTTLSRLPSGMGWLQVQDIKVGGNTFTLRHDGATSSKLTNSSGSASYTWEARFAGTRSSITVNGVAQPVQTKTVNGKTYTYATVTVAPGQTATATVS
ncbi:hypothetical protein ACIA8O_00925 [Kitasatospora sp. NPDC051853]|uniref:hypothetical protein n=1 Tax=Kitasatospora sp. NPDC051853 TaxID=3364058 RepID=UPI0037B76F68